MYMSTSNRYFRGFILASSIVITFTFWRIKHHIDDKMNEQYRLGYNEGWSEGYDDCFNGLEMIGKIK